MEIPVVVPRSQLTEAVLASQSQNERIERKSLLELPKSR